MTLPLAFIAFNGNISLGTVAIILAIAESIRRVSKGANKRQERVEEVWKPLAEGLEKTVGEQKAKLEDAARRIEQLENEPGTVRSIAAALERNTVAIQGHNDFTKAVADGLRRHDVEARARHKETLRESQQQSTALLAQLDERDNAIVQALKLRPRDPGLRTRRDDQV